MKLCLMVILAVCLSFTTAIAQLTEISMAKEGVWTVGDVIMPVAGCWDHEDFKKVKEVMMNWNWNGYVALMGMANFKCVDMYVTGKVAPLVKLVKMLDSVDKVKEGYQLQFWSGLYGPKVDEPAWVWATVSLDRLNYEQGSSEPLRGRRLTMLTSN